jgi:hypothetical protein
MKRSHDGLYSLDLDFLNLKKTKFIPSSSAASVSFPSGTYTVVNENDAQILTNKDLSSSTNTLPSNLATSSSIQTLTNKDLSSSTNTFPSNLATTSSIQTLTNKDLSSSTNILPTDIVRTTQGTSISITDTTQSTNSTTGALVVAGGIGIGKNAHINGTIHIPRGSAGAPSYAFIPDPTTGIFSFGSGQVNIATAGVTRLSIASSTITSTLSIVAPSGSATAPSYQLSAGSGCGIFSSATDTIDFTTNGTLRMNINNSRMFVNQQVIGFNGNAGAPSFSFNGNSTTGWFSGGALSNTIKLSTGGVERLSVDTLAHTYSLPIKLQTTGGTASNLDYYEELTHSSSWTYTGATIPSFNFLLRRIGKMVSIQLTTMGVAYKNTGGSSKLTLTTALPTRFRPSETIYMPISIEVNSNTSHRTIAINSTGVIEIGEVNTSAFAINTDLRVLGCSYTFSV